METSKHINCFQCDCYGKYTVKKVFDLISANIPIQEQKSFNSPGKMMEKTILVVGGAGFIGSHVNKQLDEAGYQTIVLDNLSTGNPQAVTRGKFIEGDLANSELLDELFQAYPIGAVMHFAACTDVGESVSNPLKYYHNNVCHTLNLLNAMLNHDVKTFIFSSSAAIFGLPQKKTITETHPCNPINPYGESKLMVERILSDLNKAQGLRFCCLRYFNAAGGDPDGEIKNFKKNENNLIPVILNSLKKGDRSMTIFGTDYTTTDGTCIRDYVHILDLGKAHISAMEHLFNGKPSSCYNLGNGQGFSVREVITAVEKVTQIPVIAIEGERRPGDPPILVADSQRACKELNWKPQYPTLEEMIAHAWNVL
jgi:UDP-glucose 4-epimerase